MTLVSAHSPVIADGRRGRSAAAFALCAGAFALAASVAGCGSSAAPMTPRTAIGLAADKIQSVTSMTATFSDQITGTVAETTSGTVKVQVKPLLAKVDVTASADGQTFPIEEIMSAQTLYLSSSILSVFTGHTGKAWFEIPLANLSGNFGTSPTGLLQDVQNGNPLTQTEMLAAAKNVRSLGTQVINGVRTTHYAGSFTASAALGSLTPGLRKQIGPLLEMVSGDIRFNAWIDAEHEVRRVTEVETVSGETVHSTINVTSVNRPVHITPPPASETVTPTKNGRGGI
jgi:hypothetical protein